MIGFSAKRRIGVLSLREFIGKSLASGVQSCYKLVETAVLNLLFIYLFIFLLYVLKFTERQKNRGNKDEQTSVFFH